MTSSRAFALWPAPVLGRYILLILGASSLLALALLWHGPTPELAPSSPAATAGISPAGLHELPDAARGPISAALAADDTAYRANPSAGNGFQTVSRPQRLSGDFERSGVTLSSGATGVSLSLRAAGYEGSLRRTPAVTPTAAANRVSYAHDGLSEWYVNGPLGLEQGFTVRQAPAAGSSGELELSLALSGNAHASMSDADRTIAFRRAGSPWLRYGALSATDATGRRLPVGLALHDGMILIRVDTSGARLPLTIDPLIEQEDRPTPSDETGEGRFGFSVALSADGDTALVGAPEDGGSSAGAAWVFTRTGSSWTQQGPKLAVGEPGEEADETECADETEECGFGRSVALSADGDTALVGAPRANAQRGAAWVYIRSGSTWSRFGERLTGGPEAKGNGSFGRSVALSADGDTVLVGAPANKSNRGAVWTFTRSGSDFVQQGSPLVEDEETGAGYFGRSLALSSEGSMALVGAPGDNSHQGAAWAFARAGAGWTAQGGKLTGGDEEAGEGRFGFSVALSADGDTALLGARLDDEGVGAAWVFSRIGSTWGQQGSKLTGQEEAGKARFGSSVALSAAGDTALIGAPRDGETLGAAWTFSRSGASWTQVKMFGSGLESVKNAFGTSVALAADAGTALIGGPRASGRLGAVWSYLGSQPTPPTITGPPEEGATNGNAAGGSGGAPTPSARSGILASSMTALSPPKLTVTGNLARLSGVVRVKLPGSSVFTLLGTAEQIPFGSIVDATHGKVSVTTVDIHGKTQTMVFYDGEFALTQHRDGLVISTLFGGDYSACPRTGKRGHRARASAARHKHAVRKLWAEGHGKYSTKGNYATGAVLGTRWLTEDLCDGTLIRVLTDRVAVTNLVTHRHFTVSAGHSYLARAPHRRGR